MDCQICTGRSISTPQSHLQAVTTIAVDPTSQFLLSGSPDSTIHVWSLPALLSFVQPSYTDPTQPSPRSPLRSLSHHRAAITHLVLGHGSSATNIAVSASQDNTCIVWDYHAGTPLKTYLLPSTPLCLALDPADRAVYAGHEDGSIQLLDFYKTPTLTNPLYDPAQQSTPAQASPRDRWPPPNENLGAVLSLAVNYDGTALITGHQSGKIVSWDVAKGRYVTDLADLAAPVTNLRMLSPTGFPHAAKPNFTVHNVVKPRYEAALSNGAGEDGAVPMNYNFSAHFTSALDVPRVTATDALASRPTAFEAALEHACFPTELLDEGLRELAAWDLASSSTTTNKSAPLPPSTGLDGANDHVPPNSTEAEMSSSEITDLRSQIADLNALVQAQHRTQKWTWEKLLELNAWRYKREKSERGRDRDRDGEVVSNGVGKGVEKWVDDDGGEGGGRGEVEVRDGEEEEEEMDSVDEDEEEEDEDEDEMP